MLTIASRRPALAAVPRGDGAAATPRREAPGVGLGLGLGLSVIVGVGVGLHAMAVMPLAHAGASRQIERTHQQRKVADMDREALEREWTRAVLDASAAAQAYAALEREPAADPDLVARAAVALWRAESIKRDVLLALEKSESAAAGDAPLAA
jgi:hypothetical protein